MKVFVLMGQDYNGCDSWEWIVDIFSKESDAAVVQIELEDANTYPDQSWFIRQMEVK